MDKVRFFLLHILFINFFLTSSLFANNDQAIEIKDIWINEAPPTVSVLAAYGKIYNSSDKSIDLISASSPDFFRIEIHRSVIKGDIVSMEQQGSLSVPAGKTLTLSPGDYHLMLFEPAKTLRSGDKANLTLTFSNGSNISVEAMVKKRSNEDHSHHHHH